MRCNDEADKKRAPKSLFFHLIFLVPSEGFEPTTKGL